MKIEEVIKVIEAGEHLTASPEERKVMRLTIEQEMSDSELYGSESPDDFPYDINDLLSLHRQVREL